MRFRRRFLGITLGIESNTTVRVTRRHNREEAPTRATQRIVRTVIVAVISIGLISVIGGCRKKGPLERLGDNAG